MGTGPPPDANDIDHPTPLTLGVVHKLTLEKNEDYYFRLSSAAAAVKIVQDIRVSGRWGTETCSSELSILDEHGAVASRPTRCASTSSTSLSRKTVVVLAEAAGAGWPEAAEHGCSPRTSGSPCLRRRRAVHPAVRQCGAAADVTRRGCVGRSRREHEDVYYTTRFTPGNYRIIRRFLRECHVNAAHPRRIRRRARRGRRQRARACAVSTSTISAPVRSATFSREERRAAHSAHPQRERHGQLRTEDREDRVAISPQLRVCGRRCRPFVSVATTCASCSRSTGLTRCASKPASPDARRSRGCP